MSVIKNYLQKAQEVAQDYYGMGSMESRQADKEQLAVALAVEDLISTVTELGEPIKIIEKIDLSNGKLDSINDKLDALNKNIVDLKDAILKSVDAPAETATTKKSSAK